MAARYCVMQKMWPGRRWTRQGWMFTYIKGRWSRIACGSFIGMGYAWWYDWWANGVHYFRVFMG